MLKLFEAFAGYGGGSWALKKANIDFELAGFSEIDKYAIQCFEQNHDAKGKNLGDITKIDWNNVPEFDLLTGGFPCVDVSIAGKRDLKKGRTMLVYELVRCLKEKQPKFFLFENVAGILTENFKEFRRDFENEFRKAGYVFYRKTLNSKDFGIPQNRVRVWWVGYRKDIARFEFGFSPFPYPTGCNLKLKDILEKEVNEKYFLSEKAINFLIRRQQENKEHKRGFRVVFNPKVSSTIDGRYGAVRNAGETYLMELTSNVSDAQRVYDSNGLAKTLKGLGGGQGAKTGLYAVGCALRTRNYAGQSQELELNNEEASNSITRVAKDCMIGYSRTKNAKNTSYHAKELSGTIKAGAVAKNSNQAEYVRQNMQIRRLIPKEAFRLQGFLNDEINLQGLSDSRQYQLAGNGWEINVVSKIFKGMFKDIKNT